MDQGGNPRPSLPWSRGATSPRESAGRPAECASRRRDTCRHGVMSLTPLNCWHHDARDARAKRGKVWEISCLSRSARAVPSGDASRRSRPCAARPSRPQSAGLKGFPLTHEVAGDGVSHVVRIRRMRVIASSSVRCHSVVGADPRKTVSLASATASGAVRTRHNVAYARCAVMGRRARCGGASTSMRSVKCAAARVSATSAERA